MRIDEQEDWREQEDVEPEPDPYEQLFLMLDAQQETQAGSAFRTLRAALKQNGLTVAAYMQKKHGGGADIAALKAAIADERSRANEMDRAGAQLDEELTQARGVIEGLRAQNAKLRQGVNGDSCWPCHVKERWIAVFVGLALAWAWFRFVPYEEWCREQPDDPYWAAWWIGNVIFAALFPIAWVVGERHITRFERKYHLVSMTDNDIYRAVARKWNEFLDGFRMNN